MSNRGRNPELSDEDYIELVRSTCELIGAPMAPTQVIYDKHDLPVKDQALKQNLERICKEEKKLTRIQVGSGFAWSVPDETDEGGPVDLSTTDWSNVDIQSIPREKLQQHPSYRTRSEKHARKALGVVEYAAYFALVGIVILGIDDVRDLPIDVVDMGAIMALAGFLFILFGGTVALSLTFVDKLSQSDAYQASKEAVGTVVPVTVTRDEGSLTISWKQ